MVPATTTSASAPTPSRTRRNGSVTQRSCLPAPEVDVGAGGQGHAALGIDVEHDAVRRAATHAPHRGVRFPSSITVTRSRDVLKDNTVTPEAGQQPDQAH